MILRTIIAAVLAVLLAPPLFSTDSPKALADQARAAMRKAGEYWATKVASHGGYVWEYTTDLVTRRRGESGDLTAETVWVQPPGTPSVGEAFLGAYEATGETSPYLDAAMAAARCLAWGQLASGGWTYRIDFNRKEKGNTVTFDDDTTQSATRFLMDLDRFVDDASLDAAIERALRCFLKAQYSGGAWDGAWPQRFPPPSKGYGRFPTFNDNTMSDCVRTMYQAYRQYGKAEYLESVKRCLEFYLRSQLPEPQAAWAQQYDENLKPAWARKFEPPAVSGGESSGNIQLLLDMHLELGDPRYLEAAGRAVSWYRRSRIGGTETRGIWARFYEVGTNDPLYFTRTYQLVKTDDDLPVHYSFKGNYGVNQRMALCKTIRGRGRKRLLKERGRAELPAALEKKARSLAPRVREILGSQDASGLWVKVVPRREQVRDAKGRVGYEVDPTTRLSMIYSQDFVTNLGTLATYLAATRGATRDGPARKPPSAPRSK